MAAVQALCGPSSRPFAAQARSFGLPTTARCGSPQPTARAVPGSATTRRLGQTLEQQRRTEDNAVNTSAPQTRLHTATLSSLVCPRPRWKESFGLSSAERSLIDDGAFVQSRSGPFRGTSANGSMMLETSLQLEEARRTADRSEDGTTNSDACKGGWCWSELAWE